MPKPQKTKTNAADAMPTKQKREPGSVITPDLEIVQLRDGFSFGLQQAPEGKSKWSQKDEEDAQRCIQTIERGRSSFLEVGSALAEMKAKRLYRKTHPTFEQFCHEMLGYGRQHAYRLIQAANITQQLAARGDTAVPQTEAQARLLAGLNQSEQAEVMNGAAKDAGGSATTKEIKESRDKLKNKKASGVSRVAKGDSEETPKDAEEAEDVELELMPTPFRKRDLLPIPITDALKLVVEAKEMVWAKAMDTEKLYEILEDVELAIMQFAEFLNARSESEVAA